MSSPLPLESASKHPSSVTAPASLMRLIHFTTQTAAATPPLTSSQRSSKGTQIRQSRVLYWSKQSSPWEGARCDRNWTWGHTPRAEPWPTLGLWTLEYLTVISLPLKWGCAAAPHMLLQRFKENILHKDSTTLAPSLIRKFMTNKVYFEILKKLVFLLKNAGLYH